MVYPKVNADNVLTSKNRDLIYKILAEKGPMTCYMIKQSIDSQRKHKGIKKKISFQLVWFHLKVLEKYGKVVFDHAEEFGERGELSRIEIDKIYYRVKNERTRVVG